MWGKISDDIVFYCGNCGRACNPYAEFDMIGLPPESAFHRMPPCPDCGQWKWEWHG